MCCCLWFFSAPPTVGYSCAVVSCYVGRGRFGGQFSRSFVDAQIHIASSPPSDTTRLPARYGQLPHHVYYNIPLWHSHPTMYVALQCVVVQLISYNVVWLQVQDDAGPVIVTQCVCDPKCEQECCKKRVTLATDTSDSEMSDENSPLIVSQPDCMGRQSQRVSQHPTTPGVGVCVCV